MDRSTKLNFVPLEVVIALTCCLGNALVIWAVWRCGSLRKPTFCFITSLAVADFLVGALVIPLAGLSFHMKTSFHSCLFMCCVFTMIKIVSVALLLSIALDRFLRVCIPLRYKSTVTQSRLWIVVALCWFIGAVWGFIPTFGWNRSLNFGRSNQNSSSFECRFSAVIPESFLVNFMFFSCLLPSLLIMTGLYCYIFLTTRRQLRAHISENTVARTDYHKEHRLATSLALVLVLFYVCWLPFFLIQTVIYVNKIEMSSAIIHIGVLLSHVSSAINPIIYAFRIPKIKEACKMLLYFFL